MEKYDIWMRNYPQPDINISEEWEIKPKILSAANLLIRQLETEYADESWAGHRMYRAKFYCLPH